MQHIQHEADTLAQRDEADHHGQNRRQKADDLIEDAAEHRSSHDAGQGRGAGGFLQSYLLPYSAYLPGPIGLVAGA